MSRLAGVLGVLAVLALIIGFAALNGDHRVTVDLGIVRLYRLPVTLVAFGGMFVGMLVMHVAGIHSDLKVRRILRDRLAEEGREEQERVDRYQRDLFAQDDDAPEAGP